MNIINELLIVNADRLVNIPFTDGGYILLEDGNKILLEDDLSAFVLE